MHIKACFMLVLGRSKANGTCHCDIIIIRTGQAYNLMSPLAFEFFKGHLIPQTPSNPFMSIFSPDLSLRQPLTLTAVLPLFLSYHAMAVLAILPNTFIFKLLLLPFVIWQAWKCVIEVDCGVPLAQLLGHQGTDRLALWNFIWVVRIPPR
jgi:hypothetical protein